MNKLTDQFLLRNLADTLTRQVEAHLFPQNMSSRDLEHLKKSGVEIRAEESLPTGPLTQIENPAHTQTAVIFSLVADNGRSAELYTLVKAADGKMGLAEITWDDMGPRGTIYRVSHTGRKDSIESHLHNPVQTHLTFLHAPEKIEDVVMGALLDSNAEWAKDTDAKKALRERVKAGITASMLYHHERGNNQSLLADHAL